jgi:hypothetical protein
MRRGYETRRAAGGGVALGRMSQECGGRGTHGKTVLDDEPHVGG